MRNDLLISAIIPIPFEHMLTGTNISKSYGTVHVLDNVNVSFYQNEIAAIIGKSGSGKSTLLHILGTLDTADTGNIKLDDIELSGLNEKQLAQIRNQKIGFIFQFHHLLAEFTALENVCIPAFINGTSSATANKRAKELLDYLGMSHRLHHKPTALSGGEQQRVAVARALVNNPSIVFADEPTGNLDEASSDDLFRLLNDLKRDFNQAIVLVTHSSDMAQKCDRIYHLSNKQLKVA